jgi:hypothetical protein
VGVVIRCDRGSIVIGWLTKIVVVMAVAGVVLFDSGSIGVARLDAEDDANGAAQSAGFEWRDSHDLQAAYEAAVGSLASPDETILTRGFTIDPDGTVHLVLRRNVPTLVTHRIGPLKSLTVVRVAGEATPPAP